MACTIDLSYKPKCEQAQAIEDAKINGVSSMETDDVIPPPAKRSAIPSSLDPDSPVFGKLSYDGVIAVRQPHASAVQVSGTTFEKRGKERRIRTAYDARMVERREEYRKECEIYEKKVKIYQTIFNHKPLKKIDKAKQRKQARVVREELVFDFMKLSF